MTSLHVARGYADEPSFSALFQPGRIGSLKLENRVLMAPMEKNLCTAEGVVTSRYSDYLVERARWGVGLLRVEATYVDPVGKGRPYQLGAHSDEIIPELTRMVAAIHAAGGLVSLELAHCGRQTNSLVTGRQPVAPSAVPCALSGGYLPRPLTVGEIAEIVERFANAASRALAAGVDAIEIHGASGYLINAFTSPYTNQRDDEYGGSLENRMRLPLEVVAAVQSAVGPDMPLLYRLGADDCVPGGITSSESGALAAELERAGVDLIDVSAGTYEAILATQPPMESDPGTLLSLAAEIKGRVQIPVATAGKLGNLWVADGAIAAGTVDFVTIGRGLHADPELLAKARSGRMEEVRRCIACAECVAFLGDDQPAYCAVNPATIRERALRPRAVAIPKRVLIVGGGPAGLEAARAARLRGHSVRVFERSDRLGGQVWYGAIADGRGDFSEPVRFLERELRRLGVTVECDVDVDAELIKGITPDVAIIATGARPVVRAIPGRDLGHVVSATDYLAHEEHVAAGREASELPEEFNRAVSVAVIGGNWIGCHVASLLLDRDLRVAVIEGRDILGYDMGEQQGAVLRNRVSSRAELHCGSTVEELRTGQVSIWSSRADSNRQVSADAVVIVDGRQPNLELAAAASELCGESVDIHVIGDCARPRKLQDALLEGATLAAGL